MDSIAFEKYCFLRLYSIDFDTALHTLRVMHRYRRKDILFALLRDVVVTYARPFSGNDGKEITNHILSVKTHVQNSHRNIHGELVRARNQQFAHTDLRYYQPRVSKFGGQKSPWYPMSFKGYDYEGLLSRIVEIEELVKAVHQSVQEKIARYEATLRLFAPTSELQMFNHH